MSRLSKRIEENIQHSQDERTRLQWQLHLAAYSARSGEVDEARHAISRVRQYSKYRSDPGILARLNLAESLVAFFSGALDESIDKARRSQAIAAVSPLLRSVDALAAAWEVHYCRNKGEWGGLVNAAIRCLTGASSEDHEALARLGLAVADSFLEAGDIDRAENWYKLARRHASECGDDALIAALIYNRAMLRVFDVRISKLHGITRKIDQCSLCLEEASARNFERYTGLHSLSWTLEILKGQLFAVEGRFGEAVASFQSVDPESLDAGWPHVETMRRADLLFCQAMLNSVSAVEVQAGEIEARAQRVPDPGDAALIADRLLTVYRMAGDNASAERLSRDLSQRLREHSDFRMNGKAELERIHEMMSAELARIGFIP